MPLLESELYPVHFYKDRFSSRPYFYIGAQTPEEMFPFHSGDINSDSMLTLTGPIPANGRAIRAFNEIEERNVLRRLCTEKLASTGPFEPDSDLGAIEDRVIQSITRRAGCITHVDDLRRGKWYINDDGLIEREYGYPYSLYKADGADWIHSLTSCTKDELVEEHHEWIGTLYGAFPITPRITQALEDRMRRDTHLYDMLQDAVCVGAGNCGDAEYITYHGEYLHVTSGGTIIKNSDTEYLRWLNHYGVEPETAQRIFQRYRQEQEAEAIESVRGMEI